MCHCGVLAPVDRYLPVDAAERLIGWEEEIEADAGDIAAHEAAFEPDPDIIENVAVVHDQGGSQFFIAEGIEGSVEEGGIGRGHDEAQLLKRSAAAVVLYGVHGAGGRSRSRGPADHSGGVFRFHKKLDAAAGLPGNLGGVASSASAGHGDRQPWSTGYGILQGHFGDTVGVFGDEGNGHRFICGGGYGEMTQACEGWTNACGGGSIDGSGRAAIGSNGEHMSASEPVEVLPHIESGTAGEPACPQRHFVLTTRHEGSIARVGGFDLVALVFAGAGSNEPQDRIARIAWFRLDGGSPVISKEPPARRSRGKVAIHDEIGTSHGVGDADVIEEA